MPEKPSDRSPVRATPASGYAGDVSVDEAWRLLAEDPSAVLVDVRTMAEWMYVGKPDLTSIAKTPLLIEWQTFPERSLNPQFLAELSRSVADNSASWSCGATARKLSCCTTSSQESLFRTDRKTCNGGISINDLGRSNSWCAVLDRARITAATRSLISIAFLATENTFRIVMTMMLRLGVDSPNQNHCSSSSSHSNP